jgi:hypothetical protein
MKRRDFLLRLLAAPLAARAAISLTPVTASSAEAIDAMRMITQHRISDEMFRRHSSPFLARLRRNDGRPIRFSGGAKINFPFTMTEV